MAITINNITPIVMVNTQLQLAIQVQDTSSGSPVNADPNALTLQIFTADGALFETFTYDSMNPGRIVRDGVGAFHFIFGNQTPNNETNCTGEYLFNWQVTLTNGGELNNTVQTVRVISVKTMMWLPEFRLLIDKSRKFVNEDPNNPTFLGYTDSDLFTYLVQGLSTINSYQPTVNFSIDGFPSGFRQILFEAGLLVGVMSQQLFAIDTDIPNYNDQGTSYVIQHQPQLAAFLNVLSARLDKQIPQLKLQFVTTGSTLTQISTSYRLSQLISAAPSGSTFRNTFTSGQ